jgi:hypothetical protein
VTALNKASLLKILNPLLILSALVQITTIIIKAFKDIDLVQSIHEVNGWVLMSLVVLHLILNWSWVRSVLFSRKKP